MFKILKEINRKPKAFEVYTADKLWTNEHTSKKMLEYHLNENIDASSRNFKFIEKSANWIIDYFNLGSKSKVIDFGCGPGLYTSKYARKGVKVTGIDFSKNSINYAKGVSYKEDLNINYVNENYLKFKTDEKFDLITMIMCDFCALSPSQRSKLLNSYKSILKPDGSILLDVYSYNFFDKKREEAYYEKNQLNGFWSEEKYYGFVNSFKYEDEKVILDKYTIIQHDESYVVYNWLQCFNEESIRKEFNNHGFDIIDIFSDVSGTKFDENLDEFAIIAKLK